MKAGCRGGKENSASFTLGYLIFLYCCLQMESVMFALVTSGVAQQRALGINEKTLRSHACLMIRGDSWEWIQGQQDTRVLHHWYFGFTHSRPVPHQSFLFHHFCPAWGIAVVLALYYYQIVGFNCLLTDEHLHVFYHMFVKANYYGWTVMYNTKRTTSMYFSDFHCNWIPTGEWAPF